MKQKKKKTWKNKQNETVLKYMADIFLSLDEINIYYLLFFWCQTKKKARVSGGIWTKQKWIMQKWFLIFLYINYNNRARAKVDIDPRDTVYQINI